MLTVTDHTVIIPGMGYLLKPVTVNKKTGKQYKSDKWHGRWKNSEGRWEQKALHKEKRKATSLLGELERGVAAEEHSPKEQSLAKLLNKFRDAIASSSTPDYAKLIHYRTSAILKEIGATKAHQIEPAKVQIAVAKLADSLRTRNHYTAAAKQFCRWLIDNGHAKRNPVAGLKPAKHDADKRYVRRALSKEEWALLAKATADSQETFRSLDGKDRLILYMVVLSTGWRAGGVKCLKVANFGQDGLVVLEARYSKNRKEQRKFLPPEVAAQVAEYIKDRDPKEFVWPGSWAQDAAEMLRIDLAAAGIPHKTDEGVLDFHAFRNTSITWLLESGTPIYLVQRHADHASPAQTMRYARPKRDNLDDAISRTFHHLIRHAQATEIKDKQKDELAETTEKPI